MEILIQYRDMVPIVASKANHALALTWLCAPLNFAIISIIFSDSLIFDIFKDECFFTLALR